MKVNFFIFNSRWQKCLVSYRANILHVVITRQLNYIQSVTTVSHLGYLPYGCPNISPRLLKRVKVQQPYYSLYM